MNTESQNTERKINLLAPGVEKLKEGFPQCFNKDGSFNFEKFKQELAGTDTKISNEGYSLNWLGKSYARILATDEAKTLLKEDENHNQKPLNQNSQNLLIKGDNLEVLKHLTNAYGGG